jgi:nucleoside-diphosphate kinase
MSNFEGTFAAIRPDCVQHGLMGEIIRSFKQKGLLLVAMKFLPISKEHLKWGPFFPGLAK